MNEVKQIGNYETGTWDNPQTGRVYLSNGLSPTLNTCGGGGHEVKIVEQTVFIKQATSEGYIECKLGGVADLSYPASKTRRGRVQDNGDTCPTLTATETGVCRIETPYRIRKLTPLECWRLMGFTDEDFHKAETVNSNTQLYKQAGNSIVVDVLEAIFRQMIPHNS
jgi:DNA (cytosine-5)-methyltransferase 1